MKKAVFVIITLTLVILGVCIANNRGSKEAETSNKPTIKIGATLPLSGDVAFAGVPAKKAIELAFRDINKKETLKYNYELIFEDDKLDSKQMVLNYNRFKSLNHINAIITMWGNAVVVSPLANQDEIIHFGCAWGYELAKGKYNFNHSSLPDEQINTLITELKKRDIKKIGVIFNTTKGDYELTNLLKPKLEENGIELVFENMFQAEQKDFRTEIVKMKEKSVDIVFISMLSPGMEIFIKQARELNYNPKYTTFNYFAYNPDLFEGQWYVTDALGNKEFMEYFNKETGESQNSSCVANLYDVTKILINAYENTKVENNQIPNNKDVAETILKMKHFDTATKEAFIDEEGNIHTNPTVNIIKNGTPVQVE